MFNIDAGDLAVFIPMLAVMYLIAFLVDKPWYFIVLPISKRKELAQDRIDVIEGNRENWSWFMSDRALNRQNKELESLRRFVQR